MFISLQHECGLIFNYSNIIKICAHKPNKKLHNTIMPLLFRKLLLKNEHKLIGIKLPVRIAHNFLNILYYFIYNMVGNELMLVIKYYENLLKEPFRVRGIFLNSKIKLVNYFYLHLVISRCEYHIVYFFCYHFQISLVDYFKQYV